MAQITKTFTVTSDEDTINKIERFFAWLKYNSGHTGRIGIPFDGDGKENIKITGDIDPKLRDEVGLISQVGYDIEIAYSNGYGGFNKNPDETQSKYNVWFVTNTAIMMKNSELCKVCLYDYNNDKKQILENVRFHTTTNMPTGRNK